MADTIAEFQQLRSSLVERGKALLSFLAPLKIEGAMHIEAAMPIFLPQEFDRTRREFVEFLEAHRQYRLFLDRHELGRWDRSYDAGLIGDEIQGKPADENANARIVHAIQANEKNRPPENPTLDDIKGALEQCLDGLPESDGPIENIFFRLGADTLAWAHRSLDKLRLYDRPEQPNFGEDRYDLDPIAVRQAIVTLLAWLGKHKPPVAGERENISDDSKQHATEKKPVGRPKGITKDIERWHDWDQNSHLASTMKEFARQRYRITREAFSESLDRAAKSEEIQAIISSRKAEQEKISKAATRKKTRRPASQTKS